MGELSCVTSSFEWSILALCISAGLGGCSEPAAEECFGGELELRSAPTAPIVETALQCSTGYVDAFCNNPFVRRVPRCGEASGVFAGIDIGANLNFTRIAINVELDVDGVPIGARAAFGSSEDAVPVEAGWISIQTLEGCQVSGEIDVQWSFGRVWGAFKESTLDCQ